MRGWLYVGSVQEDLKVAYQTEGVRVIQTADCASRQFLFATTIGVAGIWLSVLLVTEHVIEGGAK